MLSYCKHKTPTCFQNWWVCTLLLCYHPVQALLERGVPSFLDALTRAIIKPHFSPHDQTYFCVALSIFQFIIGPLPVTIKKIVRLTIKLDFIFTISSNNLTLHIFFLTPFTQCNLYFLRRLHFPMKIVRFGWRRNMKILEV